MNVKVGQGRIQINGVWKKWEEMSRSYKESVENRSEDFT